MAPGYAPAMGRGTITDTLAIPPAVAHTNTLLTGTIGNAPPGIAGGYVEISHKQYSNNHKADNGYPFHNCPPKMLSGTDFAVCVCVNPPFGIVETV